MNARQKKFADNYVSGMSATQAYIKAGYASTGNAAAAAATKLLTIANIKDYVNKLKQSDTNDTLLTIEEKRAYLAKALRTPVDEITPKSDLCTGVTYSKDGSEIIHSVDPVRAMQEDSKLAGHYAPEKREVSVLGIGDLIDSIHGGDES